MTVCKHCGKRIIYQGCHIGYMHIRDDGHYSIWCERTLAEPLIEWVTPTSGPALPEVEVRQDDEEDWEEALLMLVDVKHKHHPAYFAKRIEDGYIDYFKQCRMRKESKE